MHEGLKQVADSAEDLPDILHSRVERLLREQAFPVCGVKVIHQPSLSELDLGERYRLRMLGPVIGDITALPVRSSLLIRVN